MINDERIYLVKGKVSRNCLLLVMIITFCWFVFKAFYIKTFNIKYYGFEIVLILTSLLLLLRSLFIVSEVKDELHQKKKCDYYNKLFIPYLLFLCIIYSIFITIEYFNVFLTINYLAMILIYSLTLFTFCSLKHHNIYFHHKSIETNYFYKDVLNNILKISALFFLMFIITTITSFIAGLKAYIFGYFLVYLFSCIGLIIEYLFFTLLEKIFYEQKKPRLISNASIVAYLVSLSVSIIVIILNRISFHYLDNNTLEKTIIAAKLLNIAHLLLVFASLIKITAFVYLYYDLKRNNKTPKLLKTCYYLGICIAIFNCLSPIINLYIINLYIVTINYKSISISQILTFINYINMLLNVIIFILIFVCFYLNKYVYKLFIIDAILIFVFRIILAFIFNNVNMVSLLVTISSLIQVVMSSIILILNSRITFIEEVKEF